MVRIIDETEEDLKRLIEADFGPLSNGAPLHRVLDDWLTFRARKIPSRPRQVVVSAEVKAIASNYPALQQIISALQSGADVSPWLSDGVRTKKSDHKADLMFNDWQISHFHLGKIWVSSQKVRRTSDLLYAYINADLAVLLNIGPHGQWAAHPLLEILDRNQPGGMNFEVKGVTPYTMTDRDRENARKNGYNTAIGINGRTFMAPGMGIMSSGHPMRITHYAMHLQRNIQHLKAIIPRNQLSANVSKAIFCNLALPVRLGVILNDGGLMVLDKNRNLPLYAMKPLE